MIRLRLATPDDDATLRALLRENPMPSWVSMALTREPCFFAGADRFGRERVVIGHEAGAGAGAEGASSTENAAGMYVCAEQPLYWNGVETDVGYLGSLRVAPRYRYRLRLLREGYASIPRLIPHDGIRPWYTVIASENAPARRLLEAGLRGLPRYRPLNEMLTLALPRARGRRCGAWRPAADGELADLCRFHNRLARRHQCAPALNAARARATGAAFYCLDGSAGPEAVMALWNQQAYKQAVACAYRSPLGALRPLYNAYARLAKRVALPPPGRALDQSFLAFLAVAPAREADFPALIEDALALCPTAVMSLGLHAGHDWLDPLRRRFRPAAYRARVYAVEFDGLADAAAHGGRAPAPDGRPAQPEAALL